ncbi:AraC family transcriptional regulator [Mucilaginibacter conchicola]|uniref:AraC family transcriptional regulator n=1 Tax=Mucilaginibacter conchicola TaxID=2303333 RepID=A0A372NQJ3_9SPHI|nr:AraC family transcriptional regulator [Mucilaginibacter conchicola]RFZ91128.1 AraC family transcriptional regulator [Mucilaginibacter conchicola]
MKKVKSSLPPIVHACYFSSSNKGEQFIASHTFSFQEAGSMTVDDGSKKYHFEEGDFRFSVGKRLAKYEKKAPPGGAFKTLAIFFDEEMLRKFSAEYGYTSSGRASGDTCIKLPAHKAYRDLTDSLIPYLQADHEHDSELLELKVKEALLIILKVNPELKDILFDFSEPGKSDLESFMQKNYHFKVDIERFAFLTGRSLATFKRDFKKIFDTSPGRWLVRRRLKQAYYLIKEEGKRPTEIYNELGFEDLSHFTYAFRQAYGLPPSKI